jgi:hypothetical protein
MDQLKDEIEDSIETAKVMGSRLEELNENIVQYLIQNFSAKQAKYKIKHFLSIRIEHKLKFDSILLKDSDRKISQKTRKIDQGRQR